MQERGLKGVKNPKTPLEACAFGARLGNQSVFILDQRLIMVEFCCLRLSIFRLIESVSCGRSVARGLQGC